jgi:acyl-[acyl-carrier-protein] desaturase
MPEKTINIPEIDPEKDRVLVEELTEPAARLLNAHLAVTKDWSGFLNVDYDKAESFTADKKPWQPEQYPLLPGIRSAILVNLLTEDNLPYYTNTILQGVPEDHPLQVWGRQWTSEEWRHSDVIRDWVLTSRAIDPQELEDSRKVQMKRGEVPRPPSFAELIVYTSFQELATNVAHRNTGRELDKERGGKKVMSLVAGDELLHANFYRGLAGEGFRIDPETMLIATFKQLSGFEMPGTGIPNFARHARAIAGAGIYTLEHFLDQVALPTLAEWDIDSIEHSTPNIEAAFMAIKEWQSQIGAIVVRQARRRTAHRVG